ncbi:MAG TPA: suppressor of fused domain protein [Phycisphaerae bacterium]
MPALYPAPTRFLPQISRHIERTIGPSPMVFHEIISSDVHLDLFVVPPQTHDASLHFPHGRDFFTIVTSGMSTFPMNAPHLATKRRNSRYAELMICLPADWPGLRFDGTFALEQMREEANWWPIRWLKTIARLPHEHGLFIGSGHTIPNGEDAVPFSENTKFGSLLVAPSALHPDSHTLVIHDDMSVDFLALWPLHSAELEYKLSHGPEALISRFQRSGITELVDLTRKSAV